MSSNPQGIRNWSKLNDFDRSYIVKFVGTIIAAIITGIITGLRSKAGADGGFTNGWLGWLIFIVVTGGLTYYIKANYDLKDMTDVRILRHGIFVGFLSYWYFWAVIYNFIIFG
ncbi:MAG: hypothetical protein INQ03_08520 [Candidatus Heimdallarchaeota archaeon]|nr:hypothetical protein [Candidatus Heimdallarchaeota archaeon]